MAKELMQHPSFGMLAIHRISGNSGFLFGSNVEPNNFIEITLHTAVMMRELNHDWFVPHDEVFRVKMSPVQFAELLTSQNGEGVPVTIVSEHKKRVEQLDVARNRKVQAEQEMKNSMNEITANLTNAIKEATETINTKGRFNKDDKEKLIGQLNYVLTELKSNVPYAMNEFSREIDKIVVDAKAEISAAIAHSSKADIKVLGVEYNSKDQLIKKED